MKKYITFSTKNISIIILPLVLIWIFLKLDISMLLIFSSFAYMYISSFAIEEFQSKKKIYIYIFNFILSLLILTESISLSCSKCFEFGDFLIPLSIYSFLLLLCVFFVKFYSKILEKKNLHFKHNQLLKFTPLILFIMTCFLLVLFH